jgi:aryl-alcohol dehydrogenase-like predicted oxidoreductase
MPEISVTKGGSHMSGGVKFADDGLTPVSGHEHHINTCVLAIKSGINYIDTAPLYGGGRAEIVMGLVMIIIVNQA